MHKIAGNSNISYKILRIVSFLEHNIPLSHIGVKTLTYIAVCTRVSLLYIRVHKICFPVPMKYIDS
jgi:hypothetical protein